MSPLSNRLLAYCFVFFSRFFFPSSRSFFNRKSFGFLDCFTRQSPGIGRNELAISIPVAPALRRSWPSPSQSSLRSLKEGLGGGWARGVGLGGQRSWRQRLARQHGSTGPSIGWWGQLPPSAGGGGVLVGLSRAQGAWQNRRLLRSIVLLFLCRGRRGDIVGCAWVRGMYIRSFLRRASVKAVPAYCTALPRGWLSLVRNETMVVSTASWAPPQMGRLFAITSMRRSCCLWMWSRFKSVSKVLVVTRAPASRHTRAAARSRGVLRIWRIPDCAHVARWSP